MYYVIILLFVVNRSCIESRDPYCAYDTSLSTCVNTLTGYTVDYIQDIDNGDYSNCPVTPSSTVVTPPLTTNAFSTASSSSSLATMDIMTSTADCTMIVDVSYTTTTTTETILVQGTPELSIYNTDYTPHLITIIHIFPYIHVQHL